MKNLITRIQKWIQSKLTVLILLAMSFSSFAQFPGGNHNGGNPPFPPRDTMPGGHHSFFACNAHFFHHRDSIVNGVRFLNLRGSGAATYVWDFGDGSTSSQLSPSHTYADTGRYIVCLTVTDTVHGGCSNTHCDTIRIFNPGPRCNAHFRVRGDSVPNTLHFLTPRIAGGAGNNTTTTYSWDFGDNAGTSTSANPVYTYADSGVYNVCLTVTSTNPNGSCTSTFCDSVNTHFRRHPGPGPGHHHHHHFKTADESLETNDISELSNVIVNVYPNPMVENTTIHLENTSGNVTFRLYNITGQVALTKELGNGDFTISKNNLSEGLYFYSLEDGNTNIAKGKLQVN